ncbi:hypothetical protein ACH4U5_00045 [Streptomyces sp. NPDC020858]|uniref:hypothetical protein n=1 Tax=Streptomyces sp. NPDC020858 TaxID=3365097 RepID=UPI0037BBD4A4
MSIAPPFGETLLTGDDDQGDQITMRVGVTHGQWGCAVAPVAGLATGVLGSMFLAAAWRACDVGVNGAANGLAPVFYGDLLTITAERVWWGMLIGYVGRWNLAVALLGGTAGAPVMVWIFVALLQVLNGYRC